MNGQNFKNYVQKQQQEKHKITENKNETPWND
jgi:hypothetical protein